MTTYPRHRLRLVLAVTLAVATVSVVGAVSTATSKGHPAGAASVCAPDGASGCTVTLPCTTGTCPTVDVSPNVNVTDSEYLVIRARNFDPTGSMRVALCATDSSATDPSCLSGIWESNSFVPIHVPVTNDPTSQNLTQVAYPAFFDPSGQGNAPIPGHDITNTVGPGPGFYCDNTDPCSMIVTEEPGQGNNTGNGPSVSPSNSAVIPLTFANASAGCPSSDPTVQTDSSFSVEHFLPAATEATCGGANGVTALNTALDNQSVISDFASGGVPLAFIDNPSDPTALGALEGKGYALIPIALSGTTVGFLAGDDNQGLSFPIASYNLTPNMVAGLITSAYQNPEGTTTYVNGREEIILADNLIPPLVCAMLVGCPGKGSQMIQNEQKFDAFQLLNPLSHGVEGPTQFGSFMSSTPSGASYQVTSWLCGAPDTPYTVDVNEVGQTGPTAVKVTDRNTAGVTLTSAPSGSSIWPPYAGAPWVFPNCTGYSTLPALSATANNFSEGSDPSTQAHSIRTWAYGGTELPQPAPSPPVSAFGVMDSSESSFYGLSDASVQNASGAFVPPTAQSIEAAANDVTPCTAGSISCPPGTYAINYANSDPAAYPMPDITYAVVNTAPQPAATASALTNLLTNLVTYSHTGALPAGYAPLPTGIYQTALTDISADIVSEPAAAGGTTPGVITPGVITAATTGKGPAATGRGQAATTGTSPFESGLIDSGLTQSALALPDSGPASLSSRGTGGTGGSGGAGGATVVGSASTTLPHGILLVALDAAAQYLLPFIVLLALACLLGGSLLLVGPPLRRRRRAGGQS